MSAEGTCIDVATICMHVFKTLLRSQLDKTLHITTMANIYVSNHLQQSFNIVLLLEYFIAKHVFPCLLCKPDEETVGFSIQFFGL